MDPSKLAALIERCQATSEHSVTVYDRPRSEPNAQVIGTVNAGPRGVEAHRPHYSLADRSSARVEGEFATIGDGVAGLIADHEANAK